MDAEYEHAAKSYYSADEQLVVHQITRDSADHTGVWPDTVTYGDPWGVYEEYWYDALGRRVLKRSRQDSPICTYSARCYSSTTRFVWDGDQILWELRQSGAGNLQKPTGSAYTGQTGTIGYVHAGGIDAPLGMVRNGNGVVLHRSWRGLYETATKATNGDEIGSSDVPWPGVSWSTTQTFQDTRETHTWVGSLSMGQQDHTGLNYRRNRYFDSASGQFTQQDPIGIAGGLNLYGYANGDPVNFSDPFGLCPEEVEGDDNLDDCEPGTSEWYAARIAKGEGNELLNTVGGTLASCAESIGCMTSMIPLNAGAAAAGRVGNALRAAGAAVDDITVAVGSKLEAAVAGKLWTLGGRAIRGARRTGEVVGRIAGDHVYRFGQIKGPGHVNAGEWVANLVNKATGGNTHLLLQRWQWF